VVFEVKLDEGLKIKEKRLRRKVVSSNFAFDILTSLVYSLSFET
tara:strand:+ start:347 stop:478 length:132 start_codon:yes stop_codon:yes gene_type:complete